MVVDGPLYFFQTDETEYVRRKRKTLSLIDTIDDETSNTKQDSVAKPTKEAVGAVTDASRTRPGTDDDVADESSLPLTQDLITKIEEDAKVFLQDGLSLSSNTPSLHKFLPLLKQAMQTFEMIDPAPVQKMSLHEKYNILKAQSGELFEDLTQVLELVSKDSRSSSLPVECRDVFTSTFGALVADTEVEYREWQRGSPPNQSNTAAGAGTAGKINSQVSELTDGSRSGRSRYSRRQKTMMSGGDTDGGTSSRSNEGTVYGAVRSARRESARRKNMVSDQSDIIEDLYLETEHSDTGSRIGKERSGMRRKEMESLFEVQTHNTTINFSLISQTCASKGWIANQGDSELKDKSLVMYLLERLQKCKMNKAMEVKQLNQMRFPAMIKYYSELDSEPYKTRRPFSWSARHKIGFVTEVPQNINSQFIFAFPDGSTTLYYPNGSICAILSNFAMPKEQELTRTVNIFHHIQPGFIVASFNPSGVGSCWYDSKSPAFLSTILGGCIYDKAGVTCKSWSWNNIDTEDFLLPINDVVSLYFTAAGEVNLHLQLAEECICLNVKTAKTPLEDSTQNPTLLSTVAFNSVTAQTILNAPKTRGRRKMRQKRVSSTRVTDDSETEEILYPHKHSLADPTDRHLINTTRKVTKNVEEFLLFFRQELSLGRTSQRVSRNTSVAKAGPVKSESTLLKMPDGYQSLPKGCRKKTCVTMNLNCAPYLVFPERGDANKKKMCKGGRGSSATSRRVKLTRRRLTATCPAALRVLALTGEETMCKCDWRVVPMVTDAEFDRLIAECAPQQLVIVSVYSSKHPEATPCDAMVEEIFYGINYSRSQPCVQSVQDKYRLLRYDISTNNLLKNRHNAIPGMFFIYCNARILFSDLIFNGYGTAKKDFMKQVFKCGKLAEEGKFLPEDFKFTGMKSWDEADDTVRQVLTLQFGKTSGWIAPKLTPLTRREDMTLFGW